MADSPDISFSPDYAVPPGETLDEILRARQLTQADLARRAGRPLKTINEIVQGKAALTPETALQLDKVLDVPARFWNNLERNYREALARQDERSRLAQDLDLLDQVPVKELLKYDLVKPTDDRVELLSRVLGFFGVASAEAWQRKWADPAAAFRKSPAFQSSPGATAAWLRVGELVASQTPTGPFDAPSLRGALSQVRLLTTKTPEAFLGPLRETCAECGVLVAFVPEFKETRVSGSARWLSQDRALIQISARYRAEDQIWFTFFHECGHLLLHGKREWFIDTVDLLTSAERLEMEASTFAADVLIPPDEYSQFLSGESFSELSIRAFALDLGISPAIVVGRLQHDRHVSFKRFWGLKRRYSVEWRAEES